MTEPARVLLSLDEPVSTGPDDRAFIYLATRRSGLKGREHLLRAMELVGRKLERPTSRPPSTGAPAPYELDAGIGGRPRSRFTTGHLVSALADTGILKLTPSGEADLLLTVTVSQRDPAVEPDEEPGLVDELLHGARGAAGDALAGLNRAVTAGVEAAAMTTLIIFALVLAAFYVLRRYAS